jgi:alpha-tubulin suppressor-like RCC1 family protein
MSQDEGGSTTRTLYADAARTATTQVFGELDTWQRLGMLNRGESGAVHLLGDVTGYFTDTCAGNAGCVFVWGAGATGQFGDGTSGYRAMPEAIPGFGDVVAVEGGAWENMALRADGTVWVWGHSEAVPGLRADRPQQKSSLSGITAIAAGRGNGLALGSDGTVWSWGRTLYGQIGDGVDHEADYLTTPVRVAGLTDVVAIAAGYDNGYAVKSDGTVWAWGDNTWGRLGNGVACDKAVPGTCESNVPVQVVGMTDAVAVADEGFALKSDGTAWVWGTNHSGLLGNGTTDNQARSLVAIPVPGLTDVVAIEGGVDNRYALKADGTVLAWGSNAHGQIGNGSTSTEHVRSPVAVSGLTGAVAIALGEAHNGYALTSDGSLWAWGDNLNYQLGRGRDNPRTSSVPLRVDRVSGIGVTRISAYAYGLLALVPAG